VGWKNRMQMRQISSGLSVQYDIEKAGVRVKKSDVSDLQENSLVGSPAELDVILNGRRQEPSPILALRR